MDALVLILLLLLAALVGAVPPLCARGGDRSLHLFLSLAAGFFLGVVFLHLLPELAEHARATPSLWRWTLGGLVGLLVLDLAVLGPRSHEAVAWGTLVGLSVHAVAAGLGLGVHLDAQVAPLLAGAMLSHKCGESFSLAAALRLTGGPRLRHAKVCVAFALLTPIGLAIGTWLREGLGPGPGEVLGAVAAGSFLYVAVGELLPEVFHERSDRVLKVLLLAAGLAFATLTELA